MGNIRPPKFIIRMIVVLIVLYLGSVFLNNLYNPERRIIEISFSEFMNYVESGQIDEITIYQSGQIEGILKPSENSKNNIKFKTKILIPSMEYAESLRASNPGIKVEIQSAGWTNSLLYLAPFLIMIGFWIFFMTRGQTGRGITDFGRSKAKLASLDKSKLPTFADVAGADEAKAELQEIIEFLKNPNKFTKLGGRIPKGVLLTGPPGIGKTLLARAVAGEAGVPFFSLSGSDFVEMFVGVGASRVRDLFENGKKQAPCIIFIDEIDAIGRHRGTSVNLSGGHEEREQTLNQLLSEMDGFESSSGVIIVAATNRPDVLDTALLRPGRFDRRVVIDKPDVKGRLGILQVHTKKVLLGNDVDLSVLARGTTGFTGADLADLVNEATLRAATEDKKEVDGKHLEWAKDKILMGGERRSLLLPHDEKLAIAYHEAGHAVVALFMPDSDPIHKVTIIPRGESLGSTLQLPLDDRHNYSEGYLRSQLAVLMGGRISEKIFLDKITTGASNDIEIATEIARRMVCEWGMSAEMGPIKYDPRADNLSWGRIESTWGYSENTRDKIDAEIRNLIRNSVQIAQRIIEEKRRLIESMVQKLMGKEALDADEIRQLVDESV